MDQKVLKHFILWKDQTKRWLKSEVYEFQFQITCGTRQQATSSSKHHSVESPQLKYSLITPPQCTDFHKRRFKPQFNHQKTRMELFVFTRPAIWCHWLFWVGGGVPLEAGYLNMKCNPSTHTHTHLRRKQVHCFPCQSALRYVCVRVCVRVWLCVCVCVRVCWGECLEWKTLLTATRTSGKQIAQFPHPHLHPRNLISSGWICYCCVQR